MTLRKHFILRDWKYGAALVAAPIVWGVLYWIDAPRLQPVGEWIADNPFLFLLPAIVYPILEELAFRGLMQGWLITRCSTFVLGISYANLITSVLFASLHFLSHPPLMASLVFIPSIIFGYFRDRYHGRLLPSIMLHMYYSIG